MFTHLFSSRQACMSCLNEGGEVRKVGKGSVFFCLQRIDMGMSLVSKGGSSWLEPSQKYLMPSGPSQVPKPGSLVQASRLFHQPTSWPLSSVGWQPAQALTEIMSSSFLLSFSPSWVLFGGLLWSRRIGVDGGRSRREVKSRWGK